ncbi:MAG TPA: hypothetical protein EYG75_02905 [Campylobacterales bacterium]|nr:hypothetical protein [Campylobacterales bacterium]
MEVISNVNGILNDINFNNETIPSTIQNHKELIQFLIPKSDKAIIVSPFLMKNFGDTIKNQQINGLKFT